VLHQRVLCVVFLTEKRPSCVWPPHQRQVAAKAPLTLPLVAEHAQAVSDAARACGGDLAALATQVVAACRAADDPVDSPSMGAAVLEVEDMLAAGDVVLWGPGATALMPTPEKRLLSDFIGRNDKSKVLIRLQTRKEGQPAKEGGVSAEEQAAMLALLRRKQQEAADVAGADDVETDDAPWANPRALKTHFSGVGNVRIGGKW
jgi:hypothetical protein